jgi:hypothetical protein
MTDNHLDPPDPIQCPICYERRYGYSPEGGEGPDYDPEDWSICMACRKDTHGEDAYERMKEDEMAAAEREIDRQHI